MSITRRGKPIGEAASSTILILYLDTSLLVAALTNETETSRMQRWLRDQAAGDLTISEWVSTEFSAALSMKVRTGALPSHQRGDALATFKRLADDSFEMLTISEAQVRVAARFADQYALGLRAGDSLHLAIAADHGASVVTLDRRLAEAALALGVSGRLL